MALLWQHIAQFEKTFPNRNWVLAKRGGGYLASSVPKEYIAQVPGPNPEIVQYRDRTPDLAFEGMLLKTMRKENVQQNRCR